MSIISGVHLMFSDKWWDMFRVIDECYDMLFLDICIYTQRVAIATIVELYCCVTSINVG